MPSKTARPEGERWFEWPLTPTSIGMTVTIRTSIIAIEEHDVLLEIKAWDEQGDIGHGQHKRAIISRKELEKKENQRTRFLTNRSLR